MICHPEILRTEKFGGRGFWEKECIVCHFCGQEIFEDGVASDIVGRLFCGDECRAKEFYRKKGKSRND